MGYPSLVSSFPLENLIPWLLVRAAWALVRGASEPRGAAGKEGAGGGASLGVSSVDPPAGGARQSAAAHTASRLRESGEQRRVDVFAGLMWMCSRGYCGCSDPMGVAELRSDATRCLCFRKS